MPQQRANYGAPKLPRTLLDQVQGSGEGQRKHNGVNTWTTPTTRKDKRKLEREHKRSGRYQVPKPKHTSRPLPSPLSQHAAVKEEEEEDDQSSDDEVATDIPAPGVSTVPPTQRTTENAGLRSILKKPNEKLLPTVKSSKQRKDSRETIQIEERPLSRREKEKLAHEDAQIAALEKRLGIKSKKLPKSFEEDGLASLLGDLDDVETSHGLSAGKRRAQDVQWLERKRRKVVDEILSGSEDDEGDDVEHEDENGEEFIMDMLDESNMDDSQQTDVYESDDDEEGEEIDRMPKDEEDASSSQGSGLDEDGFDGFDSETSNAVLPTRIRENPYVAPGAGIEKSTTKYIPPSLREASSSDTEVAIRLRRQVQGLVNRLSETNLISILGDVEQLYQCNPRQYVTSTLIDLLLVLIGDRTALNDTFIILHAGFIAAVYKVVGSDFGAQMIERIVAKFDECYYNARNEEMSAKVTINMISLLAQLYNLQVIGNELVFDYVRSFLNELNEEHTELLLRVVRSSGPQLRQDDPSSLKDIVVLLQKTMAKDNKANFSVRTKFMIETINDLKNNKLKTGAATSAVTAEHLTRMRKILGSLNNRSIKGNEPLRIGLGDIRNTDRRGKWWLVGASWKGNNDEQPQEFAPFNTARDHASKTSTTSKPLLSDASDPSTDLLTLAKGARMNTDIRRAIFITIMSASDYKDAHLRLLKLNLKRSQELEIPRVLLHCAGAERVHNPYYTLIANKLCGEHKLRMAFQFGLWDLFRKLGERGNADFAVEDDDGGTVGETGDDALNTSSIVNYGKMFGNLMAGGKLGLNVLKNIDLIYLQPRTKSLLEVLFVSLFLQTTSVTSASTSNSKKKSSSSTTLLGVPALFTPALEIPGLKSGLQWFLRKVVAKTDLVKDERERVRVRGAVKEAEAFLAAGEAGE